MESRRRVPLVLVDAPAPDTRGQLLQDTEQRQIQAALHRGQALLDHSRRATLIDLRHLRSQLTDNRNTARCRWRMGAVVAGTALAITGTWWVSTVGKSALFLGCIALGAAWGLTCVPRGASTPSNSASVEVL